MEANNAEQLTSASFITGGVFECDRAHRRYVAVLCMLHEIMCNQMHPLYGAPPEPNVTVRVTTGPVMAYWYTYAPPRCKTSQYRRTFISLSVYVLNDIGDQVFDGVGPPRFQKQGQCIFIGLDACSLFVSYCFPLHSMGWYCSAWVSGLIGCQSLSPHLALPTFF